MWRILPSSWSSLRARDRALVRHLLDRGCGVDRARWCRVWRRRSEPSQASRRCSGRAVARPPARTGPNKAALGGDQQVVRVRVERLGDQLLADIRAVRVGGVDQVDAEFDSSPEDGDRLVVVGRRAPDPRSRDPHRPEPKPAHPAIADLDRANVFVSDAGHAASSNASFSSWSARSFSPRFTWRIDQEPKPSSARNTCC